MRGFILFGIGPAPSLLEVYESHKPQIAALDERNLRVDPFSFILGALATNANDIGASLPAIYDEMPQIQRELRELSEHIEREKYGRDATRN